MAPVAAERPMIPAASRPAEAEPTAPPARPTPPRAAEPPAPNEQVAFEIFRNRGMEVEIPEPTRASAEPRRAHSAPQRILVPVEIDLDEIAEGQGIEIVLQISPAMRDTKLRRVSG
jgi:hypothetical protein